MKQIDEIVSMYLAMDEQARILFGNFGERLAKEWPASKKPSLRLVKGPSRNFISKTVNQVVDSGSKAVIAQSVNG